MLPTTTALLSSLRSRHRRRSAALPTTPTMAAEIAIMATNKTPVVMTESLACSSLRRRQQQQQQHQLRQDHPIDLLLCRSTSQRQDDDERDGGGPAAVVPMSTCVEFGLAWVPGGPATYATMMMMTMVAAAGGGGELTTTAPATEAGGGAATNGPDLGGRRDDSGIKNSAVLLVLLMHFNTRQYELLLVSHHHDDGTSTKVAMTEARSVGEYVDAALRDATLTCWEGGEMDRITYSACLRLRVSLVPSSSGPTSSPSIRTQLLKRPGSGGTDDDGASLWSLDDSSSMSSSHHRLGRRPSVVVEVVVPVPTGQCSSRALRRARKILALPQNVRALTRAVGLDGNDKVKKKKVGDGEGVSDRFGPPMPRTESIHNDRALTSRPESRNGRTPLGSARRPEARTQEKKQHAGPNEKRCNARGSDDPSDKENVNSTRWGTGPHHIDDP